MTKKKSVEMVQISLEITKEMHDWLQSIKQTGARTSMSAEVRRLIYEAMAKAGK